VGLPAHQLHRPAQRIDPGHFLENSDDAAEVADDDGVRVHHGVGENSEEARADDNVGRVEQGPERGAGRDEEGEEGDEAGGDSGARERVRGGEARPRAAREEDDVTGREGLPGVHGRNGVRHGGAGSEEECEERR